MDGDDELFLRGPRRQGSGARGTLRLVDLFSGLGGMTIGADAAARAVGRRLKVALAVEARAPMAEAYRRNFQAELGADRPDVLAWFDRRVRAKLSSRERDACARIGRVDLLVAGPPCQGHSTLNNHTRGDDPKNALYDTVIRSAEVLLPEALVIENVPALERDARGTLDRALRELRRLGYRTDHGLVRMEHLGVPQLRKRHILLAHRERQPSLTAAVDRCRIEPNRTVGWAIGDLERPPTDRLVDRAAAMTPENLARARYLIRSGDYDLPNPQRPKCQQNEHKYKSMYGRLDWRKAAQTITTGFGSPGQGRYIHPSQPRTITPHEAARLQFLPDWFDLGSFEHRRTVAAAIGNAVPPKLVFALAIELLGGETALEREVVPRLYVASPSA